MRNVNDCQLWTPSQIPIRFLRTTTATAIDRLIRDTYPYRYVYCTVLYRPMELRNRWKSVPVLTSIMTSVPVHCLLTTVLYSTTGRSTTGTVRIIVLFIVPVRKVTKLSKPGPLALLLAS